MAEKIHYTSSWQLPKTDRQTAAITRQCLRLGIKEHLEEKSMTRWEARLLLYELRQRRNAKV